MIHARAILLSCFFTLILTGITFAHSAGGVEMPHLAETMKEWSLEVAVGGLLLMFALSFYAVKTKPRKERDKKILFGSIVGVAILATLFLAGGTIYLNIVSATGGPVHWHTDFEVWNCGQKLDLIDPTGFDNKIGTAEVHEHGDDRMHIEGTLMDIQDASYHYFFDATGNTFANGGMTYVTNNGVKTLPGNGMCNGQPAQLQAFVYHVTNPESTKNWNFTQTKITYPFEQIMAPHGNIPPGDCLIIEYGPVKEKTEHICTSYRLGMERGELHGR